jgi:hypothetical protein
MIGVITPDQLHDAVSWIAPGTHLTAMGADLLGKLVGYRGDQSRSTPWTSPDHFGWSPYPPTARLAASCTQWADDGWCFR